MTSALYLRALVSPSATAPPAPTGLHGSALRHRPTAPPALTGFCGFALRLGRSAPFALTGLCGSVLRHSHRPWSASPPDSRSRQPYPAFLTGSPPSTPRPRPPRRGSSPGLGGGRGSSWSHVTPRTRVKGRRTKMSSAAAGDGGRRDRGPDPDYDPALDIERIESSTVRLLDEQKRMVGVVSVSEAVQIADDNYLILAILSLDGDPPVLRLFEEKYYKKHKYKQQKKKRIQQKRSIAKRMGLKELKMGYNIDIHDYSVRLKAARKFLKAGDKVKMSG